MLGRRLMLGIAETDGCVETLGGSDPRLGLELGIDDGAELGLVEILGDSEGIEVGLVEI